ARKRAYAWGPIFQRRRLWVPAYGVPETRASRGAPRGDERKKMSRDTSSQTTDFRRRSRLRPRAAYPPVRLSLLSISELAKRPVGSGGSPMQIMRVLVVALGLAGVCAGGTWSQPSATDYPNRQVNLVVPFAPGGGTDILGRLIGQKLTDRFGKAFVVENRPGASTETA